MTTVLWILAGIALYLVILWRFGEVGSDRFWLAWCATFFVLCVVQRRWGWASVNGVSLCGWAYWLKRDLAKRAQRTEGTA